MEKSPESTLLSAKEVCIRVEEAAVLFNSQGGIKETTDLEKFPWISDASDHLPQTMVLEGKVKLMSWNILNRKYLKWMLPRIEDGVDISQRLHHIFADEDDKERIRNNSIVDILVYHLQQGFIVCLQEASPSVLSDVNKSIGTMDLEVVKIENGEGNFNAVLFDQSLFNMDTIMKLTAIGCREDDGLPIIRFTNNSTKFAFWVLNVHVDFGKNQKYADALLSDANTDKEKTPMIICGDFNASSRWPKRDNDVDHISVCYADPAFKFVMNESIYFADTLSHVNTFQNAKKTYDQMDRFDHIITMNM